MSEFRYIKLGEKGCYAESCILGQRTLPEGDCIRLGYETSDSPGIHEQCLRGNESDWEAVRKYWREVRLRETLAGLGWHPIKGSAKELR